jgi:hypothetical protein
MENTSQDGAVRNRSRNKRFRKLSGRRDPKEINGHNVVAITRQDVESGIANARLSGAARPGDNDVSSS